jgi:hypothetical protein
VLIEMNQLNERICGCSVRSNNFPTMPRFFDAGVFWRAAK